MIRSSPAYSRKKNVSYRGERSGSEEEFARGREGIRSEDRLLLERVVVFVHTCRSSAPSFLLSKEPGNAMRTQAPAHSHHYSGRIHSRPDTHMFGSLGRDECRGPVGSESVSGTVVTRPPCKEPACPQAGAEGKRWRRASRSSQVAMDSGQDDHLMRACWTERTPLDTMRFDRTFQDLQRVCRVRRCRGDLNTGRDGLLQLRHVEDIMD